MATHPNELLPIPDDNLEDEPRLSHEEGWALIDSLFGSAKEMYASVGGSDAFMREERAGWDERDAELEQLYASLPKRQAT